MGIDLGRVDPNGGAIALNRLVGATGAIVLVKALYELADGGRRALCTMCIGGQGTALAIERPKQRRRSIRWRPWTRDRAVMAWPTVRA